MKLPDAVALGWNTRQGPVDWCGRYAAAGGHGTWQWAEQLATRGYGAVVVVFGGF
ncbi:hypothetical protein AB0C44_00840 [Micromonospora taraxaci]|uniref:hypothetical protein n=1 Tax=Micromonospora TaxID=1873 RepID=UPI0033F13097